jgi:positive regulator of sigma E activity
MLSGNQIPSVKQLFEYQTTLEEVGVVSELREKRIAIVLREEGDGCSSCGASGGCCIRNDGGDGGDGGRSEGKRRIFADNIPYARVGDTVRVEIETSAGIVDSQSFLYVISFIMLALGLAVGYFIANLIAVGIPAALLSLLIGCAFMVGTMGVLRFGRQAVVQDSLARIVEIIDTADQ